MTPQGRPSLALDLCRWAFWTAPTACTKWLGRQLFDKPIASTVVALPVVLLVATTALVGHGVWAGWWGPSVRQAWQAGDFAHQRAEQLRAQLEQHLKGPSPELVDNAPVEAWSIWQEENRHLKARLAREVQSAPSPLRLNPPPWRFPPSASRWEDFYEVHHALLETVYAWALAGYLLLGVAFGWKDSGRWWRRRRRSGLEGASAAKLFLGLDDAGRAHYLPQEDRNRHVLIAGTTGSGKTEALKRLARHDIESGRGLVFIDMKGDRGLAEALFAACVQAGRRRTSGTSPSNPSPATATTRSPPATSSPSRAP